MKRALLKQGPWAIYFKQPHEKIIILLRKINYESIRKLNIFYYVHFFYG